MNKKLGLGFRLALLIPAMFLTSLPAMADASTSRIRIAVAPFQNISSDPAHDWLSAGIAEALTFGLSQVARLQVVERQGMDRILEEYELSLSGLAIPETASRVGKLVSADFLLLGSFQVSGDSVRVICRVAEVASGLVAKGHSWSRTNSIQNIFFLQDELIDDVANSFEISIESGEQARIASISKDLGQNLDAYKLYLKGRQAFFKVTPENYELAIDYFRKALALSPDYALALAGMSTAYLYWGYERSWNGQSYLEKYEEAVKSAGRAIELAGNLSETHTALALIYAYWLPEPNLPMTRQYAEKAIAINPNNGEAYFAIGKAFKDVSYLKMALKLNPNYILAYNKLGLIYFEQGKYSMAMEMHQTSVRLNPSYAIEWANLAYAWYAMGDYRRASDAIDKSIKLKPDLQPAYELRAMIRQKLHEQD